MSLEALAIVLHHSKARGTAKLVALGIANHDGDGGSWPSMRTLAKYANVDARNARKAVAKLQALGEIRVTIQGGGTMDWDDELRPNRYDILLACPPQCDRTKHHRMPGESTTPPLWKTPRTKSSGGSESSGGPPDGSAPQTSPPLTPTHRGASPTGHARPRDLTPACSECTAPNLTTCAARQSRLASADRHSYTPVKGTS